MDFDKNIDEERRLACVECDGETWHKVLRSAHEATPDSWNSSWGDYEILMCQGCRTLSFRQVTWSELDYIGPDVDGEPSFDKEQLLFPSRVKGRKKLRYYSQLPKDVAKIYDETHKAISSEQPILGGMGIRALVEAVCSEKATTGSNLKERIDNLVTLGVLTKEGADILHHTRIYGNRAAHETASIKEEDLGVLMDIAENLLENVYILPMRATKLKENKDSEDRPL
jgi:hypothetical protein